MTKLFVKHSKPHCSTWQKTSLLNFPQSRCIKVSSEEGCIALHYHVKLDTTMFRRGGPSKASNLFRSALGIQRHGGLDTNVQRFPNEVVYYMYRAGTSRKTLVAEVHFCIINNTGSGYLYRWQDSYLIPHFNIPRGTGNVVGGVVNPLSSLLPVMEGRNSSTNTNKWMFWVCHKMYELQKTPGNNYWTVRA